MVMVQHNPVFYYENGTLDKYKNFQPDQILIVTETEDFVVIEQSEIVSKVVYLDFGSCMSYVCFINNFIECD